MPLQSRPDPQPGKQLGRGQPQGLRTRNYRYDDAFREAVIRGCAGFPRAPLEARPGLRRAAVAIAIAPEDQGDRATFLLTMRAAQMRAHASQWAFPGGRVDEGEAAIDAALREMDEELGLRLSPDSVIGILDDYATRSGYLITPVVVWAGDLQGLALNPEEVAAVHRIPIEVAAAPAAFDFVRIPESDRPVIRFLLDEHRIHAPTAAMLYQFVELLAGRCTRVAHYDQPVFAWR